MAAGTCTWTYNDHPVRRLARKHLGQTRKRSLVDFRQRGVSRCTTAATCLVSLDSLLAMVDHRRHYLQRPTRYIDSARVLTRALQVRMSKHEAQIRSDTIQTSGRERHHGSYRASPQCRKVAGRDGVQLHFCIEIRKARFGRWREPGLFVYGSDISCEVSVSDLDPESEGNRS